MTREEDVSKKVRLVGKFLEKNGASAALLKKVDNFAWITSGARSYVTLGDLEGIASILLTKDGASVFSKNPETTRLVHDELPDNLEVTEYPWFEDVESFVGKAMDSDDPVTEDDPEFAKFLLENRTRLSDYEIKNYEETGSKTAKALEKAMKEFTPDMTEIEAKALVEAELARENLDTILVLVFGDESRSLYRHNLVRNVKLGRRIFASVNSKMHGLVISATRTVEFGRDKNFEKQYEKNVEMETEILDASLTEKDLFDVFEKIMHAYSSHGYRDEWRLHHQGGLAGYNSREIVVTPTSHFKIGDGTAFAWNPTVTGTKSEDTYVRTKEGMKLVSIDKNGDWPYTEKIVNGRRYLRPEILKM